MPQRDYQKALSLPQVKATLDAISVFEGADYNTLFGGAKFYSYENHPNKLIKKSGFKSTAAGRYQIIFPTWVEIQKKLKLPDFTPNSQDIAALYLIDKRNAWGDMLNGNAITLAEKISWEWASIPPHRYSGQGSKGFDQWAKIIKNSTSNNKIILIIIFLCLLLK